MDLTTCNFRFQGPTDDVSPKWVTHAFSQNIVLLISGTHFLGPCRLSLFIFKYFPKFFLFRTNERIASKQTNYAAVMTYSSYHFSAETQLTLWVLNTIINWLDGIQDTMWVEPQSLALPKSFRVEMKPLRPVALSNSNWQLNSQHEAFMERSLGARGCVMRSSIISRREHMSRVIITGTT